MDVNSVLSHVVLGAILGMVGQSARVVIGLKKVLDQAGAEGRTFNEKFSANVLVVSLIIGGVAGVLALLGVVGLDSQLITKEALMAVIAAGYAGTDFIEGVMKKAGTPIKSPTELPAAANLAFIARRRTTLDLAPTTDDVVTEAVLAELRQRGTPTDNASKTMADFKYDMDGMRKLLADVQQALRDRTPPYYFQFDDSFTKKALAKTVIELIAAVTRQTSATNATGGVA